jgi:hypothetical protein
VSVPAPLCAKYSAVIVDRDTQTPFINTLPENAISGEWKRILSTVSDSQLEVDLSGGIDSYCCERLDKVDAVRHELAWYREGTQPPVWQGPIYGTKIERGKYIINARDRSEIYRGRPVTVDVLHTSANQIDSALLAKEILAAMEGPDPTGLQIIARPSGILTERQLFAAKYDDGWDAFTNLAQTSVDWSMQGLRMWIGGRETDPNATYGPLGPADWVDDDISTGIDAYGLGTQVIVKAGNNLTAVYPPGPPTNSSPYGWQPRIVSASQITVQAEVDALAKAVWSRINRPEKVIESINFRQRGAVRDFGQRSLGPNCSTFKVPDAIPGSRWSTDFTSLCQESVSGTYRLSTMRVQIDDGHEAAVQPSFEPLGELEPA